MPADNATQSPPEPDDGAPPPLVKPPVPVGLYRPILPISCCMNDASVPGDGCPMGAQADQPLLLSPDGGQSWAQAGQPLSGGVPICFPGALVALSPTDELVVSSAGLSAASGELPALLTKDGGRSWQVISLPALPDDDQLELVPLPDGAVLEAAFPTWLLLPAGGTSWCPVRSPVTAASMAQTP